MAYISPITLAVRLEECIETTIDKLVINLCVKAGFLTEQDIKKRSCRYQWVLKLTQHCEDAIALEELVGGEPITPLTISNCDKIMAQKQKKAKTIVEVVAKEVIRAIPAYQG
ncbi:hypothetical protein FJQ87_04480 [Shewanella sp. SNU WT4]|uniref:hypothetical protein n=1 Tax=Shewanella sp. SNU WT4 TaxID=2590015 RepID=UPI00112E8B0B|nr:hypothetical protein [Shewanella sp. SNU WT4]QDF66034.1 hypothetical protein FJQ87_04480 [Shewanella sp. SNU WT4]